MTRNNKSNRANAQSQRKNAGVPLTRAPVAINRSSHQTGRTTMRYKECERVATVPGSSSFGIVGNLACNPGLPGSFPWLSGHAALYDKYKVHKLVYRYKNLKGTGSDGNILMSFDYDTLDAAPSSAVAMTQSTAWIDGSPWRIFELHVATDGRKLFTRSGAVSSSDLKTYDMGRLFLAAEGCADTSDHGYLEVEYDIELFDKAPLDAGASPSSSAVSQFNLSANEVSPTYVGYDEEIVNGIGITNTAGVFSDFPDGLYIVTYDITSSGTVTVDLQVNSLAVTPPCSSYMGVNSGNSATRYLSLTSSDSVRILITGAATMYGDFCRILFQRI